MKTKADYFSENEKHLKKAKELINNPRFRMAYDFLVLRSQSIDPELKERAEFWTTLQK